MKKKLLLVLLGALLIILVIFIFRELFIYKTIAEALSDQINNETEIEGINVTVYLDNGLERRTKTTIKGKEIISTIQSGFTNMELKKVSSRDIDLLDMDYSIEVIVTNLVAEKHYSTETINLAFNNQYLTTYDGHLNYFEIISESNHVETIELLLKNEGIEWVEY